MLRAQRAVPSSRLMLKQCIQYVCSQSRTTVETHIATTKGAYFGQCPKTIAKCTKNVLHVVVCKGCVQWSFCGCTVALYIGTCIGEIRSIINVACTRCKIYMKY